MTDEPEPIVDTHVHFWDRSVEGLRWAWLEPGFTHPRLGRLPEIAAEQYTVNEFRRDSAGSAVGTMVHIQAAQAADPVVETQWLTALAAAHGWPGAIVGYADLSSPQAAGIAERHQAFPLFRGIRDLRAGEHLDDPAVIRGFHEVASLGAPIEVMTSWQNYDKVASLAAACPDVTVILGHAGLPVARDRDYYDRWAAGLRTLAERPNIVVKISALASGTDPQWTTSSLQPWFLGCIEAFGPDRCMLGSNWPIDSLFGVYARLIDAYRKIASALSADERRALFRGTAERVYSL